MPRHHLESKREVQRTTGITLESFVEELDLFADAPDAVAKMRELVPELAVQGKLPIALTLNILRPGLPPRARIPWERQVKDVVRDRRLCRARSLCPFAHWRSSRREASRQGVA